MKKLFGAISVKPMPFPAGKILKNEETGYLDCISLARSNCKTVAINVVNPLVFKKGKKTILINKGQMKRLPNNSLPHTHQITAYVINDAKIGQLLQRIFPSLTEKSQTEQLVKLLYMPVQMEGEITLADAEQFRALVFGSTLPVSMPLKKALKTLEVDEARLSSIKKMKTALGLTHLENGKNNSGATVRGQLILPEEQSLLTTVENAIRQCTYSDYLFHYWPSATRTSHKELFSILLFAQLQYPGQTDDLIKAMAHQLSVNKHGWPSINRALGEMKLPKASAADYKERTFELANLIKMPFIKSKRATSPSDKTAKTLNVLTQTISASKQYKTAKQKWEAEHTAHSISFLHVILAAKHHSTNFDENRFISHVLEDSFSMDETLKLFHQNHQLDLTNPWHMEPTRSLSLKLAKGKSHA